ncbi:hypothetical protein DMENIID0001_038410 [Sergentomyia squamirostris]
MDSVESKSILFQKDDKCVDLAENWIMDPCLLPRTYQTEYESLDNFNVRPDDVWFVGYPKSGTMWAQEMIWLICNNLDYEGAKSEILNRFQYLEENLFTDLSKLRSKNVQLNTKVFPRFLSSHLPCHFLPKQLWTVRPRIVYLARNLKDVAISMYHYNINFNTTPLIMECSLENMIENNTTFGSYHSHVTNFWNMRHLDNIIFLTYEEMKSDLPAVIEKLSKFMGKSYNEDQVQKLTHHLSFENHSKNPYANGEDIVSRLREVAQKTSSDPISKHARRGEVGSYKDEMPPEFIRRFNEWTESEMKRLGCDPELRKVFFLLE